MAVVADDLSGAAETAAVFFGRSVELSLRLDTVEAPPRGRVVVSDLNTRSMTPEAAARTLSGALAGLPTRTLLVKKIDSLLRGHVGTELTVLARRGPLIVAPALPVLARTVRHGVLHVAGTPLHETGSWAAEPGGAPQSVAELFPASPTAAIPTGGRLAERLAGATAEGRIAICDTESDDDLDAIVRAGLSIPGAQFVGSAALAAAIARTLPAGPQTAVAAAPARPVLTVVGTAEPIAARQVTALLTMGVCHVQVDACALQAGRADPAPVRRALACGSAVITLGGAGTPADGRAIAAALGRFVAAAQASHRPHLVLTGGETARAVIDAIGLTCLQPVEVVHHGAVICVAPDGRRVVTRPGSFGDHTSLCAITAHLTPTNPNRPLADKDHT